MAAHEEAYRWGTNKRFAFNEFTQACQVIVTTEATEQVAAQPTAQAQPASAAFFAGVAEEKLLKIGIPTEMTARVMTIATLDDLDTLESLLPADAYENLFNIMDGENIDAVIAEIEEGRAQDGEDKLLSNNNRRRYVELTDDDDLQRIIDLGMDKWQIFLHPSQSKLVNADYKGPVKVSGGAGTGKTIAAIHRLKHLCENPEARVLFTTFTRTLSENLVEPIEKLGVPKQRYVLKNIDNLLIELSKRYGVLADHSIIQYEGRGVEWEIWEQVLETETTDFDHVFLHGEYVNVILNYDNRTAEEYMLQQRTGRTKALSRKERQEVWGLVEKYVAAKRERKKADRLELYNEVTKYLRDNNIHPFTNVIADEFQDLSTPELRFLRALVPEGPNDIFMTGDPIQRIYPTRINFSEAGINVRGTRSRKLKINYRTTEPIKRMAVNIVKGGYYDDMDGGAESLSGYVSLIRNGERPQYLIAADAAAEMQQVVDWVDECIGSGIQPAEICIAAPSANMLKEIEKRLHADGRAYRMIKGTQKQGNAEGLNLCTCHSLKGLEFRVVILTSVNERNYPSRISKGYPFNQMDAAGQKEHLQRSRSLLYVALTRARQLAYMVGTGEATGLVQLTVSS